MTDLEELLELNGYDLNEETIIVIDGFDEAVIGITTDNQLVYDYERMAEVLMKNGTSYEEAIDYIDYNVIRALPYLDNPPIIMYELEGIDDD